MRILMMTASYPPVLGGLQTATHALARYLIAQGHQVLVVASRYPRILPRHETLDGVVVQRELFLTPQAAGLSRRPDLLLGSLLYYPLTLLRLRRLVRTFRPQVLNVHFPDTQIPFALWLRQRFCFQLVVSLHGDDVLRWFRDDRCIAADADNRQLSSGLRALLREADVVTACSQYLLGRALALEPSVADKGLSIYNGIDPARFADHSAYSHPRPYILACGRLTRKKGFDLLLEAFAALANRSPSVDLILAGDGEQRAALAEQTRQLGIERRVLFFGHASQRDIVRLLNGCALLAVPSREEPFGIVALEGMAAGKPVLATSVGGVPEILPAPPNQLVPPSVEGLRQGLAVFLEHLDLFALSAQANRARANSYTWGHSAAIYTQLFK